MEMAAETPTIVLVVVLGRDVTLIDAATGRETDLGTTVGAKDIEGYAVHTLVWSPDGTRIAYDGGPGGGSATRSTWRAASRPCSYASPRVRGRSKTSTGRRMARTWRSRTSTRRTSRATSQSSALWHTRRRRCTSRTRMGPTSASWTTSSRVSGRSGSPVSVSALRGRPMGPDSPTRASQGQIIGSFRSGRSRWTAWPHRWSRRNVASQMGGSGVVSRRLTDRLRN
jgi:hypothetical protein